MYRKEARELVMQIIFQMDVQKDFENPDIEKYLSDKKTGDQKEYIESLITFICSNISSIDEKINEGSTGWPVSRMAKTDLAIIRTAAGEILFMDDVPRAVAINEAINLAKSYGTDQSPKFINAVLAKIDK